MSAEVVSVPADRRPVWWSALRLTVVALWLVAAALSWWTAPRESGYDQARQDVAAGRVTAYQWGQRWDDDSSRWFGAPRLEQSSPLGPLFAWRTADGRVHWTDTDGFEQVTVTRPLDKDAYANPGVQALAEQIKLRPPGPGELVPYGVVIDGIGIVLAVTFLGVLLAGLAPVLGTKWFWWWMGMFLPYGLGLLCWLFRDRPWVPAAERIPRAPGLDPRAPGLDPRGLDPRAVGDPRDRGWAGVVIGIVGSLLISALLMLLHHLLGARWVPA